METTINTIQLNCLIVDDEPMALSLIKSYVEKTPFLSLFASCGSAIEALQYINNGNIDLVFLDIQMPELSGIELSKIINKKTKIIFTTAFDQYAIEGFKVDALDYLLKPFNYTEFLTAANKALNWYEMVNTITKSENLTIQNEKEFLFVKSEYKQLKIKLNEVILFEGLKDYIKIWMENYPKPILTLMSLKSLENELSKKRFMRIHRSFIVNLDKIETIERSQIIIGKKRITISEMYKDEFQEFVSKNMI